ncbi:MAG: hypothetical protein HXK72_01165 [Clostridiales bacterium]|nr:hypothetical protein [Clostridiales bacterium]
MKKFLNASDITLKSYKDTNDEIGKVIPLDEKDDELKFHIDMKDTHVVELELTFDEAEKRDEKLEFQMDEDMFLIYIESYKYNKDLDQLVRYKTYQVVGDDDVTIDIDENVKTISFISIGYINKDKEGNITIKRQKQKVKGK